MTARELEARGRAACAWYDAMRPYFDALVLLLDEGEGDEIQAVALKHIDRADYATISRKTAHKSPAQLLRRGYMEIGYIVTHGPWDASI